MSVERCRACLHRPGLSCVGQQPPSSCWLGRLHQPPAGERAAGLLPRGLQAFLPACAGSSAAGEAQGVRLTAKA